jgi:hypothetical protein
MSLKARNTLRKIDIICLNKEHREPIGIYTYDLSFGSQEQMTIMGFWDLVFVVVFYKVLSFSKDVSDCAVAGEAEMA